MIKIDKVDSEYVERVKTTWVRTSNAWSSPVASTEKIPIHGDSYMISVPEGYLHGHKELGDYYPVCFTGNIPTSIGCLLFTKMFDRCYPPAISRRNRLDPPLLGIVCYLEAKRYANACKRYGYMPTSDFPECKAFLPHIKILHRVSQDPNGCIRCLGTVSVNPMLGDVLQYNTMGGLCMFAETSVHKEPRHAWAVDTIDSNDPRYFVSLYAPFVSRTKSIEPGCSREDACVKACLDVCATHGVLCMARHIRFTCDITAHVLESYDAN